MLNYNIKNKQQSTVGFTFAQGIHSMAGTYTSGNVRACELGHTQLLQQKWRYCGGGPGALDVCTSSKGPRQHQGTPTQQSNGLRECVAPYDDGQGSFI